MRSSAWGCAAGLAMLLAGGKATADPALWIAQSPTATVYLFGTMHVLPHPADWFTPKIRAAFGRSTQLWEEADVGIDDQAKIAGLLAQGFSATDLFTTLPPAYARRLSLELAKCGLPEAAVQHLRPWLAAMLPSLCTMLAGADAKTLLGPEAMLLEEARRTGKGARYFETVEQQIGYMEAGTETSQIRALEQAIDEAGPREATVLAGMETAWLAGDEAGLLAPIEQMKRSDPAGYRVLFVERNQRFATAIAGLLRGHGTAFVAIGAGHLAGPDSVQARLELLHVRAVRQ